LKKRLTANQPNKDVSRARRLAAELRQANEELAQLLESVSDEQWHARVVDEDRELGVVALHVARAHPRIGERVMAMAKGLQVPIRRPDLFDERNRREAAANPRPDREQTIALLRAAGEAVAAQIERLSDADLDRSGEEEPGLPTTTEEVIVKRQIGHVRSHSESVRKTVLS
jgi:uncharacterized damage-inducible protein DinB